jgi:phosphorylcholine metabolism protein LicD
MSSLEKETFYTGMDIVHKEMEKNGIPYFAICGTLLATIRGGEIIPWDDDIDLGILESDMDRFNSIDFRKYGYTTYPASGNNCGKIYLNNKQYIDIFPFRKVDNRYEYLEDRARQLWPGEYFFQDELFPLKKYKFGNLSIYGPKKFVKPAERAWGPNWKKPVFKFKKKIAYPIEMISLYFGKKYSIPNEDDSTSSQA